MTARKPRPPNRRSVSATLRTHDFRAFTEERGEGFEATQDDGPGTPVWVEFIPDYGDSGHEAAEEAYRLRDLAHQKMAAVLRRKGWQVAEHDGLTAHLIVKEK